MEKQDIHAAKERHENSSYHLRAAHHHVSDLEKNLERLKSQRESISERLREAQSSLSALKSTRYPLIDKDLSFLGKPGFRVKIEIEKSMYDNMFTAEIQEKVDRATEQVKDIKADLDAVSRKIEEAEFDIKLSAKKRDELQKTVSDIEKTYPEIRDNAVREAREEYGRLVAKLKSFGSRISAAEDSLSALASKRLLVANSIDLMQKTLNENTFEMRSRIEKGLSFKERINVILLRITGDTEALNAYLDLKSKEQCKKDPSMARLQEIINRDTRELRELKERHHGLGWQVSGVEKSIRHFNEERDLLQRSVNYIKKAYPEVKTEDEAAKLESTAAATNPALSASFGNPFKGTDALNSRQKLPAMSPA